MIWLNQEVVFSISNIKHLSVIMNCSTCVKPCVWCQAYIWAVLQSGFTCSSIGVNFRSRQWVVSERIAT